MIKATDLKKKIQQSFDFIDKLEKRISESNLNQVISEESLKSDMQEWFKLNG